MLRSTKDLLKYAVRQAVKESPPYDSAVLLDREREISIHEHYARSGYRAPGAEPKTRIP